MLGRNSPFRFALTMLLAFVVPFCCCDFSILLVGCTSCDAATHGKSQVVAAQAGAERDHGHAHGNCRGHSSQGDSDEPAPGTTPEKDQDDCTCGQNTGKMLTVEKSTLDLPAPVVVAILDWSGLSDLRPLDPFKGREIEKRVVERRQTSLLRMHCALIV